MQNRLVRWLKLSMFLSLACSAILAEVSPAQAWFKICNQTSKDVWYEHAISDSSCGADGIREKGWWFMGPGQCVTVFSGSMSNRWFGYYAEASDGSLIWNGGSMWDVPWAVFDRCGGIACINCPPPPPGSRNLTHRARTGTATNYTLNLTP
jgi:uncharacterized membrane protein